MVAVCGSGAADTPRGVLAAAAALGRGLVDAGFRVSCGGLGGVMEAVCRGARASARWTEGATVGILPGYDASAANPYVDVCIASGLGLARNVVLVGSADAVVAVGGGSGTLAEMALAWQLGKPLIALDVGFGWSHELAERTIDERRPGTIVRAAPPDAAVDEVVRALGG
jgi:uncharacterized protein (TIGR00725 family)